MEAAGNLPAVQRAGGAEVNEMTRTVLRMAAAAALVPVLGCGYPRIETCARPAQFQSFLHLVIGQPAPDFQLEGIDGKPWRLSEQRGKLVFVQFGSSTSPSFVQSLDDFRREVLSRYLLNPQVVFAYVFADEAHPELLSVAERKQYRQNPHQFRAQSARQYYYQLQFRNDGRYLLSGFIPSAENVVILIDDAANSAARAYGYGRGGTTNPAFFVDQNGILLAKALYTNEFLAPSNYKAGNLPVMLQTRIK